VDEQIRAAIIVWLGAAYIGPKDPGANPDYYGDSEVAELVAAILKIVQPDPAQMRHVSVKD
jgi:hypothetical protein